MVLIIVGLLEGTPPIEARVLDLFGRKVVINVDKIPIMPLPRLPRRMRQAGAQLLQMSPIGIRENQAVFDGRQGVRRCRYKSNLASICLELRAVAVAKNFW